MTYEVGVHFQMMSAGADKTAPPPPAKESFRNRRRFISDSNRENATEK